MDQRVSDTAAPKADVAASRIDRALARLRQALPRLKAVDAPVRLELDGADGGCLVSGAAGEIAPAGPRAEAAASLALSPDNLVRLIDGQLDPRSGLLFGQLKVTGDVAAAMRFCDAAAGVQRRSPDYDAEALPRPTRDIGRAKQDLARFGYCLVEGALTSDETAALRARLRGQAEGEAAAGLGSYDGGPGGRNQRVWALVNKGQEFIDLLDHPLIDEFVPDLLGDHAIIFSYSANIAGPGGQPQILHYDQISVQPPIPDVMVGLNIAFFLDAVTDANGGTRIVPCSGERGRAPDNPFSTQGTIAAEGPPGTALIWDSRVWHGTGPNRSDGLRHVILLYFNRHFMRAQENWALSLRDDVKATLSDRAKTMLGFRVTNTLGGVEGPKEGSLVERPAEPVGRLESPLPLGEEISSPTRRG